MPMLIRDFDQFDNLQSHIDIFSDLMVLKKQREIPVSDLRTNHAGVVSPLSSTRLYHNGDHHYDVTATHDSGFKASCRNYTVLY